ncbi:MAG: hypothetical protein ACRDRP_18695 [Pseudonocardiaceae bacterium]
MGVDSPDVVIAKGLLDQARLRGFTFWRAAPGEDAPLIGQRVGSDWADILHIAGFSSDCLALRQRTSALILPGGGLVHAGSKAARSTCPRVS